MNNVIRSINLVLLGPGYPRALQGWVECEEGKLRLAKDGFPPHIPSGLGASPEKIAPYAGEKNLLVQTQFKRPSV
jgi:hypothetical protein